MSRENGGKPTQKSVWKFKAEAIGCSVGTPPDLEKFQAEFPPDHEIHQLVAPMKVGTRWCSFSPGSEKVLCQDGMFKLAVQSSQRFVLCRDKAVARALSVPQNRWLCDQCNEERGKGEKCRHAGNLWGFFGLTQVFDDVTHMGFGDLEIVSVENEYAGKIIRAKDAELATARARTADLEQAKADAEKQAAAFREEIETLKAEAMRNRAKKPGV